MPPKQFLCNISIQQVKIENEWNRVNHRIGLPNADGIGGQGHQIVKLHKKNNVCLLWSTKKGCRSSIATRLFWLVDSNENT